MANDNYKKYIKEIESILEVDNSFDIIKRELSFHNRSATLYFIDGFTKDDGLQLAIRSLFYQELEEVISNDSAEKIIKSVVPNIEVSIETEINTVVDAVLAGQTALLIEGFENIIVLDVRTYPSRGPQEPDNEMVLRGARDSFVETIVFNTSLLRRRIRDPKLVFEMHTVGKMSKTDVAIGYIDGIVNEKDLEVIKREITSLDIEALTVGGESLIESINSHHWVNPFPKVRYTERPDIASAHVMEGNIVIFIDNNPSALLLPISIFDFMQEPDDYYYPVITGNYLRFIRAITSITNFFITPIYLYITMLGDNAPEFLKFIQPTEHYVLPILLQLIVLELAIDGLKLASLNTPSSLGMSLSVIGALVLGEYAVSTGWFTPQAILYMAVVALGSFILPSVELSYALKFFRILTLILTRILGVFGIVLGVILLFITLYKTKTIAGNSYLYPLIPFNGERLKHALFRTKITRKQ